MVRTIIRKVGKDGYFVKTSDIAYMILGWKDLTDEERKIAKTL